MNLVDVEAALKAWVATLTGIAANCVLFENAPRVRHNGQVAYLSWVSMPTVGTDEVRYEADELLNAPVPNLTPTVLSLSKCTLQISIESLDQRPEAPHAFGLARALLNRVRRPSSLAALRAVNIGYIGSTGPTNSDYLVDDHMVSRAVFEVMFNASNLDRDTDNAIGSIESVDVTSNTLDGVDGEPLPPTLQMDHVVIP